MNRRTAAASAAVAGLVLAGCGVSMPRSGPVVETRTSASTRDDGSVNINPRRPGKGDTPEQIVRGFLEAMTATPAIRTSVAREFLTREARSDWQPTGMIVYSGVTIPHGNNEVETTLNGADRTDGRGAWLGPMTEAESTIRFPMEREDGQWRISVPPGELIVPQSWFEQRFRQVSLYFFDPSGAILVPEPVFVPRGQQFVSTLVNGLLQGPSPELAAAELTFLPSDLRPLVSVPVSASGVADVDLTSDTADDAMPAPPEAELLVSQLAWTLRQDPTIERFHITIGGRPVQLPDGETEFSVDFGDKYAPYVEGAGSLLYGVQGGRMVGGTPQALEPVPGPFGQENLDLRAVAPDLTATQAAGVSASGTTLWVAPVTDDAEPATPLITNGEDLLDPAWDFSGRLWEVDRRRAGAVVHYLRGDQMRTLDVQGISGEDVKDFLVSRDGSRLIAVIRQDAGNDAVVVSRILTTGDGQVVSALPSDNITPPDDLEGQIRDIAWHSPTSLAVLHPVSQRLFQVRSASVDGAPTGLDTLSVTIDDKVLGLAGTPVPGARIYAFVAGGLVDLAGSRANRISVDPDVTSLGYVG
jgi:hypothetical protein